MLALGQFSGFCAQIRRLPVVVDRVTTVAAGAGTRVLNLPDYSAGDLLGVAMGTYSNVASTNTYATPAGWNLLVNRANGWRLYFWYKFATGSEGSTLTVSRTAGDTSSVESITFSARNVNPAVALEKQDAIGSASVCDPPAISPSWNKKKTSIFFTFNIWDQTPSAYSPEYTSLDDDRSYGGAYSRPKRITTENPAAMTGANGIWVSATVAAQGVR